MAATKNRNPSPPERWADDLTRMLWMGLDGRADELARYARRVLPRWQAEAPDLAGRLADLLKNQGAAPHSPVRRVAESGFSEGMTYSRQETSAPDKLDSELLRIEMDVALPVDPVWPTKIRAELESLIHERESTKRLAAAGLHPTHTVIFTGSPGVGKTLAARWLAKSLGLPLATLNLGTVMSSYLGRTGANLRQVLHYAQRIPCVLLLDEIDAIAKRRDDQSDIGELKRLVTVLLQELDAWPPTGLLIATTNHEQLIDPAVWRRFERRIVFPLPEAKDQGTLLERLLGTDWLAMDEKARQALSTVAAHLSPADLTLIAHRAKREQILGTGSLADGLESHLGAMISSLPLAERRKIGADLASLKLSQRTVQRLTGLARETIRKHGT